MIDELVQAAQRHDWQRATELLYEQWSIECPKLYSAHVDHPWEQPAHDDPALSKAVLVPLAAAFTGDAASVDALQPTLAPLNAAAGMDPSGRRPGAICGHVFRCGEPCYKCNSCATDNTCVLCETCFQNSVHKNHKYQMHMSGGSGYCDCGDADAWTSGYACDRHAPLADGEQAPQLSLPIPLRERLRGMTAVLLRHCTRLLCAKADASILPAQLRRDVAEFGPIFQTILFNDETHTYDSVIRALELSIHCSRKQAMLLATIVDREGRSSVRAGSRSDCEKAKVEIQRRTSRDTNRRTEKTGPLEVKVVESVVVAHQSLAIAILAWLNAQTEHFPALSEVMGETLVEELVELEEEEEEMEQSQPQQQSVGEPQSPKSPAPMVVQVQPDPQSPLAESEVMETDDGVECGGGSASAPAPATVGVGGVAGERGERLVVRLMRADRRLWKAARNVFHEMLMKSVLMHMQHKQCFAEFFMQLYSLLYSAHIDDDHDHDCSIVSLSVQFLTVGSLARKLISERDALATVFDALHDYCKQYVKSDGDEATAKFDFANRPFPATLKRALMMVKDNQYMLNMVPQPSEWTPELRTAFISGFEAFIRFLHHLQDMDCVRRQAVEHQVWELEWETAFNIQLRVQECISTLLQWAVSDAEVHRRALSVCLTACEMHPHAPMEPVEGETARETHTTVEVNGCRAFFPSFDVLKGTVSIHQPLWRLLAGLFAASPDLLLPLHSTSEADPEGVRERIARMATNLYEAPLRVVVLCAQSAARLWRRNGFSLVNQIHNYFSPLCRTEMFDRDLLMLQVGGARTPRDQFMLHVLTRFRAHHWADLDFGGTDSRNGTPFGSKMEPEETSQITCTLVEEMLATMIQIIGERYRSGVGECDLSAALQREIVHMLCVGPQPFSAISRKLSHDPLLSKLSLHDAVNAVGDFKKPTSTCAGQFHLKESRLADYNPFFYHYSKADVSAAEQQQQKTRAKADRAVLACPPPQPPRFTPFYAPLRDLLRSPVLIRVLRVVFARFAKKSRFSSDRLVHRALYLVGMGLWEQRADHAFDWLPAAEADDLLKWMEGLVASAEGQPFEHLLWWTIQRYKLVEREVRQGDRADSRQAEKIEEEAVDPATAKERRAAMAARMRAKALSQINKMQNKFMEQLKEEGGEEKAEGGGGEARAAVTRMDEDEDAVRLPSDAGFPVCLGAGRVRAEVVEPRKLTCILCQEEDTLTVNGQPFVVAAYVQRSQLFAHRRSGPAGATAADPAPRLDAHWLHAALEHGIDASTCSHTMHWECYQNLCDNVQSKERARNRQHLAARMLDVDGGEYQCPLCKRLSNTAMPLLPALQSVGVKGFSEARRCGVLHEEWEEWVSRMRELLDAPAPVGGGKKTHGRKRSHSERSLLDLKNDDGALLPPPGSLETAISSSVPTASSMNLLMEGEGGGGGGGVPAAARHSHAVLGGGGGAGERMDVDDAAAAEMADALAAEQFIAELLPPQVAREAMNMLRERGEGRRRDDTPGSDSSPEGEGEAAMAGAGGARMRRRRTDSTTQRNFNFPSTLLNQLAKHVPFFKEVKVPAGLETFEDPIKAFTKFLKASRMRSSSTFSSSSSSSSEDAVLVTTQTQWQATAHLCRVLSTVLREERKPLFGALNTRQRDGLLAMARLSAAMAYNMQPQHEVVVQQLRLLLREPPREGGGAGGPFSPRSPPDGAQSPVMPNSPPVTFTEKVTTPVAQMWQSLGKSKKNHMNILSVDMLSLAVSLMMSIGWSWLDGGVQTLRGGQKTRSLLPDGGEDEQHVMRLALCALHFQVVATFSDGDMSEEEGGEEGDESAEKDRVQELWTAARGEERLVDSARLVKLLHEATVDFLRAIALLYYGITMVPPPEALKDPSMAELEPLCRYLGLPGRLLSLLDGPAVTRLFEMWSPSLPSDPIARLELVPQPRRANLLVQLPQHFAELISQAAKFRCPSVPTDEMSASVPTMCLVCGTILCSQSYCCQKTVNKEQKGACTYHMAQCSGPGGIFLRIRDSQLIILASRNRGCFKSAPYVDEFGEVDPGFIRGNPLTLNEQLYNKMKHLWMHQGIAEEVVNQYEIDHHVMNFEWTHM